MFERYTDTARRVIFFARYEASQLGNRFIQPDHLLLGLAREAQPLLSNFITQHDLNYVTDKVREVTKGDEKVPTSVELPLSNDAQAVLRNAAEEADREEVSFIDARHLLLGLLKEGISLGARLLAGRGLTADRLRQFKGHHVPASSALAPQTGEADQRAYRAERLAGIALFLSLLALFVGLFRRKD